MPTGQIGNEVTLTLGTNSSVSMEIIDGDLSISRASVDVTNNSNFVSSNAPVIMRNFKPGTVDMGTSTFTVSFNSDEVIDLDSSDNMFYGIGTDPESFTITFPIPAGSANTTKGTFVCSGFISDFNITGLGLDSHMTAATTIKWSGQPTITVSS